MTQKDTPLDDLEKFLKPVKHIKINGKVHAHALEVYNKLKATISKKTENAYTSSFLIHTETEHSGQQGRDSKTLHYDFNTLKYQVISSAGERFENIVIVYEDDTTST